MIWNLLLQMMLPLGVLGIFGWLAGRHVRSRELTFGANADPALPNEVAKLHDVITSLQSEVHALQERQEFVERLLEKPRSPDPERIVSDR